MKGGRGGPARPLTHSRAALAAVVDCEETDGEKNNTQRYEDKQHGEKRNKVGNFKAVEKNNNCIIFSERVSQSPQEHLSIFPLTKLCPSAWSQITLGDNSLSINGRARKVSSTP